MASDGEDFVSYRWLADEYSCDRPAKPKRTVRTPHINVRMAEAS